MAYWKNGSLNIILNHYSIIPIFQYSRMIPLELREVVKIRGFNEACDYSFS
jgi:hypothetical protein